MAKNRARNRYRKGEIVMERVKHELKEIRTLISNTAYDGDTSDILIQILKVLGTINMNIELIEDNIKLHNFNKNTLL